MNIKYLEDSEFTWKTTEISIHTGANIDGYGHRIKTPYMVRVNSDKSGRWYRVYATCYSNVASHWIKINGVKLFFREFDNENKIKTA